jgi:hypothetical protein
MIKNIDIRNVRWVTLNSKLKTKTIIQWDNWVGKSTVVNIIKDMFKWKTSFKWDVNITTDDWNIIMKNWKLFENIWLWIKMDLMTPWFLMNWSSVKWINATTEDRRKTISDLLWIDRDWFFKEAWVEWNIKWLHSQLKDIKSKEQAYSMELIETENRIHNLEKIDKPDEVILTQWNEATLKSIEQSLINLNSKIVWLDWDVIKLEEIVLVQWNEHELNNLKKDMLFIESEWQSIKSNCPTCWQVLLDTEDIKNKLRIKWIEKKNEIDNFILIKNNVLEYNIYKDNLNKYENWIKERNRITDSNLQLLNDIKVLEDQKLHFKLVTWNEDEYIKYQEVVWVYNEYITTKKILEERINDLSNKIKWLDSLSIEEKILKYKDTEKSFVQWVENKLVVGDIKIIFYRELVSPNTDGEFFTPTFNIEYKGKLYDECSSWQKYTIDIMVAYMFIKVYWILDFILIDSAEIWDVNLNSLINNELKDLQVIYTRISNWDLIIK